MLHSHRFTILAVSLALALSAMQGACSETTTDSALADGGATSTPGDPGASSGNDAVKPFADANATPSAAYHGNPLCHIDEDGGTTACMPDDDATYQSRPGVCVVPGDPGAMMDGSVPVEPVKVCHLVTGDSGAVVTSCGLGLPTGTDGAKCEHSADCGPGFDCVSDDKGTKTCRHYCYGGTCASYAANGGATFCDVQSLVDVNQMAPVCMPIKRCETLLGKGECANTETCTLVDDSGDTGCVAVGQQVVGESCDADHCAADLACLGQPGARKCYRLCHVSVADCPAGQSCMTNTAFKSSDDGICTESN